LSYIDAKSFTINVVFPCENFMHFCNR